MSNCVKGSGVENSFCGAVNEKKNMMNSELNKNNHLPIAIIGAGPVGLAAAAHLADKQQNFIVLESGSRVGHNILEWAHVRLFSPWQYNIDKIARKLLKESGWMEPQAEELPTGKELVENYLEPLASLPQIKKNLQLNAKVLSVSKKSLDKMKNSGREQSSFVIYVEQQGVTERIEAKAVIDATGTWAQPNPVNADNIWTTEERELEDRIFYGIPDVSGKQRKRYIGKKVAVIGGGHSAINTILELSTLGENVEIYWVMRKLNVENVYGGKEKDALKARGELGIRIHQLVESGKVKVYTPFMINQLARKSNGIELRGEYFGEEFAISEIDEIITNTGSRPDFSFLSEIRLSVDSSTESVEALSPLIDPNLHSCGTVRPHGEAILRQPEKNFYIVGMKSYGRAPTFLMATGYEQVRSIVSYLRGDIEASKKVELELPETGVCSVNIVSQESCCN
ncbi:NAD(P)-binding domain-containing protein [Ureibacillus chungkukjangi]|uniref:Pyridine nucleotide-disulfide oxidoreductase n=1 Tax=Ureibacillus chungkukjangi TaxID=1202712 RepID=A0A318U4F1_9BACL|nr:pyridine nucleotide-disulfide oxidoreductase [Ureibacillus chungkukjangi]